MSIKDSDRYNLKMKMLYYLYRKNYTQVEVAKMLNISRVTLRRLLDEAIDEGMVKIEITDVRNTLQRLQIEDELRQQYCLSNVILSENSCDSQEEINQLIASEAASYFDKSLPTANLVHDLS